MAIVRWRPTTSTFTLRPFEEMTRMMRDVERIFDELLPTDWFRSETFGFVPSTDIYEKPNALIVTMDLPGFDKNDLEIHVDNGVLTISGERKAYELDKHDQVIRQERWTGRFTRSFTLPDYVDVDNIEAEFRNGVLYLTLPKKSEAQPRAIKIK